MSDDPLRDLPWEVRPVVDPAAAKAAALRSMNATRRAAGAKLTPHLLDCECVQCTYSRTSAQQGQLERRRAKRSRHIDHRGRRDLTRARDRRELAKAKALRARRNGDGDDDSSADLEQDGRVTCAVCEGTGRLEDGEVCLECGGVGSKMAGAVGRPNVEAPGGGGVGACEGGGMSGGYA
jgi:hypothetical protein